MKVSKTKERVEWILKHQEKLIEAAHKYRCPLDCRSTCHNGRTCFTSSDGGWGWWARAFKMVGMDCRAMNYWSGSAPTPSTSINRGMAEYIASHSPDHLKAC